MPEGSNQPDFIPPTPHRVPVIEGEYTIIKKIRQYLIILYEILTELMNFAIIYPVCMTESKVNKEIKLSKSQRL